MEGNRWKSYKDWGERREMPWKYGFTVTKTEVYHIVLYDNEVPVNVWPVTDDILLREMKHVRPRTTLKIKYDGPSLLGTDLDDWNKKTGVKKKGEK